MNDHILDVAKVCTVNGGTLALVNLGDIQALLSCLLLAATLVWTVIKIGTAWRERDKDK